MHCVPYLAQPTIFFLLSFFMTFSSSLTTIASISLFFFYIFKLWWCGQEKKKIIQHDERGGIVFTLEKEVGYRRRRVLSWEPTLNKITDPVENNSTTPTKHKKKKGQENSHIPYSNLYRSSFFFFRWEGENKERKRMDIIIKMGLFNLVQTLQAQGNKVHP